MKATRDEYLISAYGHGTSGDYQIDTKILDAVEGGARTFSEICEKMGLDTRLRDSDANNWRRVDRRLQWLRKKRFLRFTRGKGEDAGWRCLPPEKSAGAA
mgnify:CR=1 FL=1